MATEVEIRRDFGLGTADDGLLLIRPGDALTTDQLRGQAHYIRRAFDRVGLDAILCIDGIPTVYLKKFEYPVGRHEANELQQKCWNQGAATLLVLLDPSFLYIFSNMALPSNDEGPLDSHQALVEPLKRTADVLEACQFVTRVASGQYYREHTEKFQQRYAVDRLLLDNLGAVGDKLRRDQSRDERKRVHAFLGRIIFTCYLIDRGIIRLQDYSFVSKDVLTLLDVLVKHEKSRAKLVLYKLFDKLRIDFNGSMFETDFEKEKESITDHDIKTLIGFLRGDEVRTGQLSLGFWAIPLKLAFSCV